MSDRLRLGVLASGAFLFAVLVGALVADALSSEEGSAVLPAPVGETIPLLSGVPQAGQPPIEDTLVQEPLRLTQVAAEYSALDYGDGGSGGGPDPGFGDGPPGAAEDGGSGASGGTAAAESVDPGFVEEPRSDTPLVELLLPDPDDPALRFLDPCAIDPGNPECPSGTGGTILLCSGCDIPELAGPFELANTFYPLPSFFSRCPDLDSLGGNEYAFMLLATHPAGIDIVYYPADDPAASASATVDVRDPTHPEFTRFVETVERNEGPVISSDRPQHCFVIDVGPTARQFRVEATATSFTGDTDSQTYTFVARPASVPLVRPREPVAVVPVDEYRANVVVPIQGDGEHTTKVRAIHSDMGLSCSDIESDVVSGASSEVVLGPVGDALNGLLPPSEYRSRESLGDAVDAPDWPYDPAYDHYDIWRLSLEEGSNYDLCVWWLQSPDRSFDSATVLHRWTLPISTPDLVRARISVEGVYASGPEPVDAESVVLSSSCGWSQLPHRDLVSHGVTGGLIHCDYAGFLQPPVTRLRAQHSGGAITEFAVPTPNDREPGTEVIWVHLFETRNAGLCGSTFGISCTPPTEQVPVVSFVVLVEFYEGRSGGAHDWSAGEPRAFFAGPPEAEALPERIQIDHNNSRVEAAGMGRLRVFAAFDRPVRLEAHLTGDPADYCLSRGAVPPTYSLDILQERYVFELGGLCTNSGYAVELVATDADGNTQVFNQDLGWGNWYGIGWTDGYDVEYTIRTATRTPDRFTTEYFVASVGVDRIDLGRPSGCLEASSSEPILATWGETIDLTVEVLLVWSDRDGTGSCPFVPGNIRFRGSAASSFTIDDFRAGPVAVDIPLSPVAPNEVVLASGVVRVLVSGRVLP